MAFREGSKLEKIGNYCFASTGIEEITLPKALKEANCYMFANCEDLKVIIMEDGCGVSLCSTRVSNSTKVCLPPETMVGEVKLRDLRNLVQVIIPDGVERIGSYWFWGSLVEKMTIPASVRERFAQAPSAGA